MTLKPLLHLLPLHAGVKLSLRHRLRQIS